MWFTQKVSSNSKLAMLSAINVFFLQLRQDTAIGAHDQQFSATIPLDHQIPLYTMLTYPGQIDKDVGLFNSYIRLCINIFKNLGHGEVMVHDKQKFV